MCCGWRCVEWIQIREAGTFVKLFDLMRSMQSTSLVVTVTRTFAVLAHGNMANMNAIHELNCIPTLIEMLSPDVGPIINAAAADLIRVLCSHRECQQSVIANNGIEVRILKSAKNESPYMWAYLTCERAYGVEWAVELTKTITLTCIRLLLILASAYVCRHPYPSLQHSQLVYIAFISITLQESKETRKEQCNPYQTCQRLYVLQIVKEAKNSHNCHIVHRFWFCECLHKCGS